MLRIVCLLLIATSACACLAGVPHAEPLRLVTGKIHVQEACAGIRLVLLGEALQRRLGIPLVCEALPWARAQQQVREGAADAMVTVPTPERAAYAVATRNPVVVVRNLAWTRARHPQLARMQQATTLAELRPWQFVTYIGNGWAGARLEPQGFAVQYVVGMDSVLTMVARGRADLLVDEDIDLPGQIAALGLQGELVALPPVLETLDLHLLLGKRSAYAARLPEIDRVLGEMQADGTTQALIERQRGR